MASQFRRKRLANIQSVAFLSICAWLPLQAQASTCSPLGMDKAALRQLKEQEFDIPDPERRERFAIELVECLGDPDSSVRDGIAYEGYVTLLRGKQLREETVRSLRSTMIPLLQSSAEDELGFRKPFVALALAEVARTDRVEPLFSDEEREHLVSASVNYMSSVSDYRGFDAEEGWRHGVAHTADLLMQLTLNESINQAQLIRIRDAIGAQVAPDGEHFYIYGEPERLARPILFMANRDAFTEQQWIDWFTALSDPTPFDNWRDIYSSQAGLAKLHNTRAFAEAIYVNTVGSERSGLQALAAGALLLLKALP